MNPTTNQPDHNPTNSRRARFPHQGIGQARGNSIQCDKDSQSIAEAIGSSDIPECCCGACRSDTQSYRYAYQFDLLTKSFCDTAPVWWWNGVGSGGGFCQEVVQVPAMWVFVPTGA